MKKVFSFIMLCLYVLGGIGGTGYLCYHNDYLFAVGVLAMAYMAFFKAEEYFNELMDA